MAHSPKMRHRTGPGVLPTYTAAASPPTTTRRLPSEDRRRRRPWTRRGRLACGAATLLAALALLAIAVHEICPFHDPGHLGCVTDGRRVLWEVGDRVDRARVHGAAAAGHAAATVMRAAAQARVASGLARVDTSGDGQSAFVLSEFEARWGAASAHAADADKRHPPPSRFVVDLGAHDGLWRSRSHFLVQHGWGALLVEPHPGSFALLRQTWPLATELRVTASHEAARPADPRPWDPTAGDERAVTIIAHAGVGSKVGYGAVVSRGRWDNTEARLEEDDHRGTIPVYPIQDLLALAHVPTRFAVLSFSVEWERPLRYAEALVGMMEGGWRADFLVLATGGDAAVRHALEDAGYEWLKTMGGDDVYYDGRAATH